MSPQEILHNLAENEAPLKQGGVILEKIEADIKAQEVQDRVVLTSSTIRLWLGTWPFKQLIDPAREVAELENMRVANDNEEILDKVA